MNAVHPAFQAALAAICPPPQFRVTAVFTDGTYNNRVVAEDEATAKRLAIQDARMASPFGSYYGALVSVDAVEVARHT